MTASVHGPEGLGASVASIRQAPATLHRIDLTGPKPTPEGAVVYVRLL